MKTAIINIHQLINIRIESRVLRGRELAELPIIENAFLIIEGGLIKTYGPMNEFIDHNDETIDAKGATILPSWCDSHTHLIFAATREDEFVDKLNGMSYAEIAAKGGGILNSAQKLNDTPEDTLFDQALERLPAALGGIWAARRLRATA